MGCEDTCCLSYDGDRAAFYDVTIIKKARREHVCCECLETIKRGESYEKITAMWDKDDGVQTFETCVLCAEIRDKFSCNKGWLFTTVWEDLQECLFDHLTTGCMDGLSAAAKNKLVDRWNEWKFGRKLYE